ncbi:Uncharacterised protein [Cedecea neteri]|uniref:Uncharacterized protein n=1 Tax=Cedecea neteri TaxID=158822 RepID=A0A2X3J9J8_9ENTR|nr:Uncharacterised protein [Cedecea neteri]
MTNPAFSLLSLMRNASVRIARQMARGLLCGGLLACIALPGYAAQNSEAGQAQAIKPCSKQLTWSDKRTLGKEIQTQLASIYQANAAFQAQLNKGGKPLNDGIVGPTTRYWMDYFCGEFMFTPPESDSDPHQVYVDALMIALSRAAERNMLYPTWRTAITPPELLTFTPAEIELKLGRNASGKEKGADKSTSTSTVFARPARQRYHALLLSVDQKRFRQPGATPDRAGNLCKVRKTAVRPAQPAL